MVVLGRGLIIYMYILKRFINGILENNGSTLIFFTLRIFDLILNIAILI